jgi:hypothetical protein
MSSAWGVAFGAAWGNAWGAIQAAVAGSSSSNSGAGGKLTGDRESSRPTKPKRAPGHFGGEFRGDLNRDGRSGSPISRDEDIATDQVKPAGGKRTRRVKDSLGEAAPPGAYDATGNISPTAPPVIPLTSAGASDATLQGLSNLLAEALPDVDNEVYYNDLSLRILLLTA